MGREDQHDRPLPPRLDPPAGRSSTHQPERAPRRRSSRGVLGLRVVAALVSAALLAGSGWGWYLTQVADASVNRTDAIPTSGNDDTSHTGADMNLLLVGNDSRT